MNASYRITSPRDLAATIHETINEVTTAVEEIHRSIVEAPLDVASAIKPLQQPIDQVREVQDRSITAIYSLIRRINDRVGKITTDLLPS